MTSSTPRELSSAELLAQRQHLEELYKQKFTREITVMFTDLKDSTALAETSGDMTTRALIQQHNSLLFPLIEQHHGTLVKTMGDGTMSYFEDAQNAVRTAVAFQRALAEYNQQHHTKLTIKVRIGINTGTGIVEENDVYGDVVNTAARLEALAQANQIYMSESCYLALSNKGEHYSRLLKSAALKGKSELVTVYQVFWNDKEIEQDKEQAQSSQAKAKSAFDGKGWLRLLIFAAIVIGLVYGIMVASRLFEDNHITPDKRNVEHKVARYQTNSQHIG